MNPAWVVSIRNDVTITSETDGPLVLTSPYGKVTLRKLPPGFADVIQRFADGGDVLSQIQTAVSELDVKNAAARLSYYLQFLSKRGYLMISVKVGGKLLATLDPMAFSYDLPREQDIADRCVLSRFAFLRTRDREAVLETPRAAARIVLHDERLAALTASLAKPFETAELIAAGLPGISPEGVSQFLSLLDAAGMLVPVDESDKSEEESDPSLAAWEFHDLLFHSRSRGGRNDTPAGATFRFLGESEPPPAVAPAMSNVTVELSRPDLDLIQKNDPPLAWVTENRKSLHDFGATPLSVEQLGEFLFRTGRIRKDYEMNAGAPAPDEDYRMQFTSRPYPAGGALYEVELYPVVNRCEGLDAGLYHYDALNHRLERLTESTDDSQHLFWEACEATGVEYDSAQVLVIMSARFQRISWKYSSIAYSLILKHVGVLYQSMYLHATAMGLGGCAIGMGDADVFAEAIGGNYYKESSVGEFLLGTTP